MLDPWKGILRGMCCSLEVSFSCEAIMFSFVLKIDNQNYFNNILKYIKCIVKTFHFPHHMEVSFIFLQTFSFWSWSVLTFLIKSLYQTKFHPKFNILCWNYLTFSLKRGNKIISSKVYEVGQSSLGSFIFKAVHEHLTCYFTTVVKLRRGIWSFKKILMAYDEFCCYSWTVS